MRIRTRLQINVILAIVIAIALGSILFIAVKVLNEGSKRERIATEIVKGMAELKTITHEYLLYPGEQAHMQWQIKYNSLSKLLTGEQFKIPEEKIILDKIIYNHTRVKNTFVELVTIYEKEQGLSKGKKAITWELEDRLTALLLVSSQAMDSAAFQLHDAIQADLVTAQKIANLLIIAFLVILTVLILITSLWINRSVVKPIAKFEKVIAIIGSGNLDYKAGKATKDEIGQLSRAFKQMTEKLKINTVSRDELSNYFIEHKQVEEALQESEGQFRQLTENIREVFWMSSPDGNRMIYTSPAYEEVWGRKPRTLYEHPKSWLDAIHPEDRERVIMAYVPDRLTQGKYDVEFRVVRPDGTVRWVWSRGFPIRNRLGDVYRIAGIAEDVTMRKLTEEKLEDSEKKYRALVDNAPVGIYKTNLKGDILYMNEALLKMLEFDSLEEIMLDGVLPWHKGKNDREVLIKNLKKAGKVNNFECEFLTKTGKLKNVLLSATLDGDIISGMIMDITGRVRVEETLREIEERLRSFIESSPDSFTLLDSELNYIEVNKATLKAFGKTREEIIGKNVLEIDPTIREKGRYEQYLEVIKTGRPYYIDDLIPETKTGDIHLNVRAFKAGDGLGIIVSDITDRKLAEEALRESEGQFRQFAENIRDVLSMVSPDGNRMIYTSHAYEEVWGQKRDTLYEHPKSWLDAIHPEDRERVITAFFPEQMIQGKYDGEFRIVRPDGSIRWVWARGFPIRNRLGNVYRIAGIAEDITERKKVNEQINKSLREKEILLREIHHRVKNNMQVIISLLMLQSEKIKDKQILEFFKESKNRIKSMALIHEKFYQSKNFINIDLNGYVKTFVTNLFKSYGINTSKISHKIKIEDVSLGLEDAIPCGLIINELVSNSLKYAFQQDRKGEIRVAFRSINEDELELTVSDNGIGIPEDLDFRNTESLGLHLVTILAEDQLNGKIELNRKVGTEYRIRFSKSKYKVRSIEK